MNGSETYIGLVEMERFKVLSPKTDSGSVRLTTIQVQAAQTPESAEVNMEKFESSAIAVQGVLSGDWIFSANVIDTAGPIVTALVQNVLVQASMSENISISGQVKDFQEQPISNIKVTIYRDDHEINHVFTDENGRYDISIPKGNLITIRFDTHPTLVNAKDWHPSVVANLEAKQDLMLNRFLLKSGQGFDQMTFIDALAGYEFSAFWEENNSSYAESVLVRMGMMKLISPVLQKIHRELDDFFRELSKQTD
jgi:hypothetical protein